MENPQFAILAVVLALNCADFLQQDTFDTGERASAIALAEERRRSRALDKEQQRKEKVLAESPGCWGYSES